MIVVILLLDRGARSTGRQMAGYLGYLAGIIPLRSYPSPLPPPQTHPFRTVGKYELCVQATLSVYPNKLWSLFKKDTDFSNNRGISNFTQLRGGGGLKLPSCKELA
jgi:hypothetical protein